LLLGVGLACLSYYMIEQPVLRLRGRKTLPAETPLTEKMSA
jgi:peptidoglycan/LPS O-acetylase OafA/YrhL